MVLCSTTCSELVTYTHSAPVFPSANEDNITSYKCVEENESVLVKRFEVFWWKQIKWSQVCSQIQIPLSPEGTEELSTLRGLWRGRLWPLFWYLSYKRKQVLKFLCCGFCFDFVFSPLAKNQKQTKNPTTQCSKSHGPQLYTLWSRKWSPLT